MGEVARLARGLTPPIDVVARYLFGGDEYLRNCVIPGWELAYHLGTHYCRPINTASGPGSTYSQHAFGLGNAIDIGLPDTAEGNRVGDEIAAWAESLPFIAQVLWRGVPLHFPGHIHLSGSPMGTGLPECKGGPKCPIVEPWSLDVIPGVQEEDEMNEWDLAQMNKAIGRAHDLGLDALKAKGYKGDSLPASADELLKNPAKYKGFWIAFGKADTPA